MEKKKNVYFKYILTIIPASILGIAAMIYNDISSVIWLQNLVAMAVCGVLAFLLARRMKVKDIAVIVISFVLLLLTFLGDGTDGVHRWIKIAILNVNAAMVVLPIMLVAIDSLLERKKTVYAGAAIVGTAVILFMQPDASQLIGFSLPVIIMLFGKKIDLLVKCSVSILLILLSVCSWLHLDALEPVSYVEGILELLHSMSVIWLVLGVAALVLIPLPYLLFPPKERRNLSVCIGIYYCAIIVSTVFGNFPVPVMGYGISPIVGYWIVAGWYMKRKGE